MFSSYYIHLWSTYFPDTPLSTPLPSFDGRAVCYPSVQNLRDYMSWRQVDCKLPEISSRCFCSNQRVGHINNLYNTTFWSLVQLGGMSGTEAEKFLAVSMCCHVISLVVLTTCRAPSRLTRMKSCLRGFISITTTSQRYTRRAVLSSGM